MFAWSERLLLDQAYGGYAFAGLISAIRDSALTGENTVLLIMMGGFPGLIAYKPGFWSE